jgi:hypothetical protein
MQPGVITLSDQMADPLAGRPAAALDWLGPTPGRSR